MTNTYKIQFIFKRLLNKGSISIEIGYVVMYVHSTIKS